MTDNPMRANLAELVGTFVLVFIGSGAVVVAPLFGVVVPALAHGLVLAALIYTYGHISGGQFNSAVTLGLYVGGKQDGGQTLRFIVMQFIGAILAAWVLSIIIPYSDVEFMAGFLGEHAFNFGQTTGVLTTNHVGQALLLEGILTFLLVSAVYQAAVYGKAGNMAGLAIGLTLCVCILAGGALTGASLNPARTLGPALVAGDLSYVPAYLVGIFGGGIVGGLFHSRVLGNQED
ncbi:MAG: aquaporin [Anaerolineaceae bacterium]|nr:aquaporin [Anaerolineaceae bacterium]